MPKVSKYGVRVSTPDMDKYLEFDVIYNSNDLFFIKVPSSYMEVFKLLSEEELKSCNSRLYLKKGHYGEENRSGKVCGKTEDEVKLNCSALFKLLNDKSVIKTDVIIVNFKKDSSDRHYSHKSSHFNDEHQKIGMSIGLKYCTKVQLGDKVTYNTYQPGYVFREGDAPYITRTEVFIDSEDVIIPDTAQNRIFLESMYIKFKSLVETIESHLSTPEAIVNLIESNQKIISVTMQYILSEEEYSRLKMPKVLTFSDVDITHFFKDNKGSIQVQVSKHDFHGLIILSKECVEAINKALI